MFKIKKVDFGIGLISFGKIKTNLLARDRKKDFRNKINLLNINDL